MTDRCVLFPLQYGSGHHDLPLSRGKGGGGKPEGLR